ERRRAPNTGGRRDHEAVPRSNPRCRTSRPPPSRRRVRGVVGGRMTRGIAIVALALALCAAGRAPAADTKFSQAQLQEMIAPVALYPDDVLSQVCIAATYPLEIVEADRWRKANPNLQGDELQKALQQKDWDPSVKSLVSMPDVLDRMSNNLEW